MKIRKKKKIGSEEKENRQKYSIDPIQSSMFSFEDSLGICPLKQ